MQNENKLKNEIVQADLILMTYRHGIKVTIIPKTHKNTNYFKVMNRCSDILYFYSYCQ